MNTDNIQYYCVGCDKKSKEKKYNDKQLKEYVPYWKTFEAVTIPTNGDYTVWGLKCMDCDHIE